MQIEREVVVIAAWRYLTIDTDTARNPGGATLRSANHWYGTAPDFLAKKHPGPPVAPGLGQDL